MKKNKTRLMLYIGLVGSAICLIADMLLGFFQPIKSEGVFNIFPAFSFEWKEANPIRFICGDIIGVIALVLICIGLIGISNLVLEKYRIIFRYSNILFLSGGILYHSIFAITAYTYNINVNNNMTNAMDISKKLFLSFLPASIFAIIGFVLISVMIAISVFKSNDGKKKLLVLINPLLIMTIFLVLSIVLPQTSLVNGLFGWGQQSLSLIIIFISALIYDKKIYNF